ncbi:DNA adenine methylase [Clostridium haemolyticum]|uniref:Site-specific DNA-methyltransferase (adenine-specific) n=1 Tax=Clostridium haemolyticum NCTC 9693 TaxID=1443114 RepID=A0ABR4TE76_CLOHA|nr:DNA adenine methylase [Clostridium haemolyticum]KEI14104.1 adenine-specific DNA methyltransferase [Clostridium haemolyticum NCTC 9693]
MNFDKKDLVKSPLNYTGGKFKLLPQILPLFPDNIDTFVDLFCGGCNVGVNVKANKIICSDTESHVINLMNYFKTIDSDELIKNIENVINTYELSNTSAYGYEYYGCDSNKGVGNYNKTKYEKLRDNFNNNTKDNLLFFVTVLFAFSNQIRFNSKGKFNMPVNKRDFNNNGRKNTVNFVDRLDKLNIEFINKDFRDFSIKNLKSEDLVYCDPPYLITTASYNEQDGWNEEKEKELLNLLDELHNQNIKFALSNVLESKGKSNDILKEWSKKYNVYYLNNTYKNCNYHKKDKSNNTIEVLITNY